MFCIQILFTILYATLSFGGFSFNPLLRREEENVCLLTLPKKYHTHSQKTSFTPQTSLKIEIQLLNQLAKEDKGQSVM